MMDVQIDNKFFDKLSLGHDKISPYYQPDNLSDNPLDYSTFNFFFKAKF